MIAAEIVLSSGVVAIDHRNCRKIYRTRRAFARSPNQVGNSMIILVGPAVSSGNNAIA